MSPATKRERTPETVQISYQSIRNLTAPEEKASGVQTYFANIPVHEVVKLATGHNLRDYIAAHNSRKRNQVHRAIRRTMDEEPVRFINRNSGITICCSGVDIDEKSRRATLHEASLINGAQTQGEIQAYLEDREIVDALTSEEDRDDALPDFHVRAEINVDPDEASVIETAIARNTATSVKSISQAGARGILEELEENFSKVVGKKITTSETDDNPDWVDTKQLLQLCRLLMPPEIAPSKSEAEILKPYKNKEKCLQEFAEWHSNRSTDDEAKSRYDFTIGIAPYAWMIFDALNKSSDWYGHRLHETTKSGGRAVRRDLNGSVVWVAPGILFPIMKALSAFVNEGKDGKWRLNFPSLYRQEELVSRAVKQFRSHGVDPYVMGRSVGAYEALMTYTETIVQLLEMSEAE